MSGFDPRFDAANAGTRDGVVPAPGAIDGPSNFLRADRTWAIPRSLPPGPQPPPPGPDLDQWACNIAGYLINEVARVAVKYVVDWLPVSWLGDVVGGITVGLLHVLLPEEALLFGGLDSAIFTWVSTYVSTHVGDVAATVLDDVAWAKLHCALYDKIKLTPTDLRAAILAFTGVLGGLVGWTTPAVAAITYFFENLGITDVGNIPVAAFVRNYDCTTCATTHIGPTKPLLQTSFDLTVSDQTTAVPFVAEIDFPGATVAATGSTATVTQNDATASENGIVGPDNVTVFVSGTGKLSATAANPSLALPSAVGVGKVYQLGTEPTGWHAIGFDDSAWASPVLETGGGPNPLPAGSARITSTNGNVATNAVFLHRRTFTLSSDPVLVCTSQILEDNTSTVWVNGTEVSSYDRPGTDSSGPHTTLIDPSLLVVGTNVLAIKIANGYGGLSANPMSVAYLLSVTQPVTGALEVEKAGTLVGQRSTLNFIEGSNVTLGVVDNTANQRVDVTVTAANSGMVNPMTTAADLIVGGTAGAPARLGKGSDGQVLTVDPSTHLLVWATPGASGMSNPMTSKGDLIAAAAAGVANRLGIGADNQFLRALASATLGMVWDTLAASDIPNLPASKITSGQLAAARGGLGIDTSGFALGSVLLNTGSAWGGLAPLADNLVLTSSASAPGGALWSSGGSGGGTNNYVLIADGPVAGSVAASVILAVAAGFNHLILKWVARSDNAAEQELRVQFSSDTGANYEFTEMSQTGNAGSSSITGARFGVLPASGLAAGKASSGTFSLTFHSGTTWHKVFTYESWRASQGTIENGSGIWHSTAAITQLKIYSNAGNLAIGSRFMLYASV